MSFRLAISATFTAEPMEPVLRFWADQLEFPFEVSFAPYHQTLQTLMDPSGIFQTNREGLNILLVRPDDLNPQGSAFRELIQQAIQQTGVPLVFALCAPSREFESDLRRLAAAGVMVLTQEQLLQKYPVASIHNPEGDRLGRIPFTDLYFAALGTSLVRLAHALFQPPLKVIALDCDNTLWRGICGEDGPAGVVIDEPRRALQQFMVDQHQKGTLLTMVSKNNARDVLETFERNLSMPLQLHHFTGWRLNWEAKSVNLTSLAADLSLGLDSFAFLDDNPMECGEVAESVPEVLSLTLPSETAEIPEYLEHIWAFDHARVTEEDRNRNASYAQTQAFGHEAKKAESLEHFIKTLDLSVSISPFTPNRLVRAAQLTQRTNQFNFTTIRRTESELQALVSGGSLECLTIDVSDRFGDYGFTGLVLFRSIGESLAIDTFLLSCRVLGRGVEHRVMAYLGAEALRRGLTRVIAPLRETKKNQPAQDFLQSLGSSTATDYDFDAASLGQLQWIPTPTREAPKPPKATARKRPDYERIARTLRRPEQILQALRSRGHNHQFDLAMNETEARLASIWSEMLDRADIGLDDNFFDLGGHSLLAVLLLVRIREAFGVELAIDDVYATRVTLAGLSRSIEARQLGDSSDYDALVREIESLSDEEVRRLLAEEK